MGRLTIIGPYERRLATCFAAVDWSCDLLSFNHNFDSLMANYETVASNAIDSEMQESCSDNREEIAEKILSEIL